MKGYKKAERLGSFRRMALAMWDTPRDGRIYGSLNIDAVNMVALFKRVEAEHGIKLTPGHIIGKGVAMGLRAVPAFNSKIIWGTIYQKETVDIFFQVDVEGGKDLSGVLIENADKKSVLQIARELRDNATKIREGKDKQYEKTQKGCFGSIPPFVLRPIISVATFMEFNLGIPPTLLGAKSDAFGTAMISNVGSFGIEVAYAPLVPPSRVGLITLVGKIHDEPVAVNGKVEVRARVMGSATFDHRLGDGNKIGLLVRTAREYFENPHLEGEGGPTPAASPGAPAGPGPAAVPPGPSAPA